MDTKFNIASFTEMIRIGLTKAQQEVEELALQFSLGKADAADKFEEIKKEFSGKVNEWRSDFAELKPKFEALQVQLALGKAEAKEAFEEQKKNILNSIHEIEVAIKSKFDQHENLNQLQGELEKFKLMLEVLKLKFEQKSFEVNDGFKKEMSEAKIKIDELLEKAEPKWDVTKDKYLDFRNEAKLAYEHLKKAIHSL